MLDATPYVWLFIAHYFSDTPFFAADAYAFRHFDYFRHFRHTMLIFSFAIFRCFFALLCYAISYAYFIIDAFAISFRFSDAMLTPLIAPFSPRFATFH